MSWMPHTRLVALKVKRLHPRAILPVSAHPGQDLGYDVFALTKQILLTDCVTRVSTGIAVELSGFGFLMRERSSLALQGLKVYGGVIDAGYRGELFVNLFYKPNYWNSQHPPMPYVIEPGQKIAQLIPFRPETAYRVLEVDQLSESSRGTNGYGSTGK